MTRSWRRRAEGLAVALVLAAPFAAGTARATEAPEPEKVFTVSDHRIVESSGLSWLDVDGERYTVTVNDSGDTGQVFTLDAEGRTVGTTTFTPSPRDVEALAPADDGHVWVGDIGDNLRARDFVLLTRVPVGPGDRAAESPVRRELVYPDRARDAEALLAHPGTGELFVVTKSVLEGRVYAVPFGTEARSEQGRSTLVDLAAAPSLITDGAFWPGGDFVLLRNYTHAHLLTFPEWDLVGSFELPEQPQGEGVTVLPDGEILLSTEGRERDVLRVRLPDDLQARVDDPVDRWWRTVLGDYRELWAPLL